MRQVLDKLLVLSYLGSIAALGYTIFSTKDPQAPTTGHDQLVLWISLLMFVIFLVNNLNKFKK